MVLARRSHRVAASAIAGFALSTILVLPTAARAQSYGPGDQVTTIPAAAFHPRSSAVGAFQYTNGYLYGAGEYTAPVLLPDGAVVTEICVYANDPNAPSKVSVTVFEVGLAAGGQAPSFLVVQSVFADFDIGFGVSCASVLPYEWHDFDTGSGLNQTHEAYIAIADLAGFGGLRFKWHRTVSPAPATATFNDVPASDPAFQFVEALVSAGVTAGCGTSTYCPDAPLTRRQMAVFLSKALGLHWPS